MCLSAGCVPSIREFSSDGKSGKIRRSCAVNTCERFAKCNNNNRLVKSFNEHNRKKLSHNGFNSN